MSRPNGFTLLELLMATVLTSLLMIGVLAVISGLHLDEKKHTASPLDNDSLDAVIRLIREDLINSNGIAEIRKGELIFEGYSSLDSENRERFHRPVLVLYKIERIEGRNWLVRRQKSLDVLTNQNIQRDLVCGGLVRFEVTVDGVDLKVARQPMKPAGRHANESHGKNVESSVPGEKSVLVNGLNFYPQYAPPQSAKGKSNIEGKNVDIGNEVQNAEVAKKKIETVMPNIVWRLKIWTDNGSVPSHDRILTILPNQNI